MEMAECVRSRRALLSSCSLHLLNKKTSANRCRMTRRLCKSEVRTGSGSDRVNLRQNPAVHHLGHTKHIRLLGPRYARSTSISYYPFQPRDFGQHSKLRLAAFVWWRLL